MFSDFDKYLSQTWQKAAQQELKAKNFEELIDWKTEEGFVLKALYQANNLKSIDYLKTFHQSLYNPSQPKHSTRNCQQIAATDAHKANLLALEALNNGVNEIAFIIAEDENEYDLLLDNLLKNILLPHCAVSFVCSAGQSLKLIQAYISYAEKYVVDLEQTLSGSLLITDQQNIRSQLLKILIEVTKKFPNFLVINILEKDSLITDRNAKLLANAVNTINELAEKGVSLKKSIGKMQFSVYITNNYFMEIAGLRALRMLFTEIAKEYGLQDYKPYHVHIQALTTLAIDEKTVSEPDWNMLSNTTQAMAAVIGGCNILTVLPHRQRIEDADSFSLRIARNVYNLLAEESYFEAGTDIAAGSYYIDILTDKVAETTWDKFRKRS